MPEEYRFRRAASAADVQRLTAHLTEVFFEGVGTYTETIFHHFPGMKHEYGFFVEEERTGTMVAAFVLVPWAWEMEGVRLRIAQMMGAATLPAYRRRGLIRALISLFEQTLADETFDLAVINGIPGFYRQFGYCYALPVESHINLPLDRIKTSPQHAGYTFRLADDADVPFLLQEGERYRRSFSLATYRDEAAWRYLLNDRFYTMFGSEFWIMQHQERSLAYYCRNPLRSHFGGKGLLVSEVSEGIEGEALHCLLGFLRQKARERGRPFIRLNLHHDSPVATEAIAMGAEFNRQSAWQIRMPDPARFLTRIRPILEQRIRQSVFGNYSGTLRLDFFRSNLDLRWEQGRLRSIAPGAARQEHSFRVHSDLFPILCLGHRSWSELAHIHPDISPRTETCAQLVAALFPKRRSWLNEPA